MSTLTVNTINETTAANGVTIDGLNVKDSALVTDTNKYAFVKGGELNSLGYLNRNFFGATYYLSTSATVSNSSDTAMTSGNGFTWTKQTSSGSSGSDDADIFGRFSGGTFTGGVSGYYLVAFNLRCDGVDSGGEYLETTVRINNEAGKKCAIQRTYGVANDLPLANSCTGVAALDANDTLTPYILQTSGGGQSPLAEFRTNISFYYLGTSDL